MCTCECGWGEGAQHLTHSVVNCACPGMAVLNPDNFPLTVYVPHERICMPCETVWIQDRIVVCFVGVHLYIYHVHVHLQITMVTSLWQCNDTLCHEVTYLRTYICSFCMYGRVLLM